ncbi:MAG: hypothetical protein LBB65_03530 [Burkholderiales bacterium]|jgi:hypothetical protein|nr:hypothetical protein [Burkholderiales bacterium]
MIVNTLRVRHVATSCFDGQPQGALFAALIFGAWFPVFEPSTFVNFLWLRQKKPRLSKKPLRFSRNSLHAIVI